MADTRVAIDAELVRSRIEALRSAYPDLNDDVELLASAVEGETDFDRVIARCVTEALEAEAYADGLHEYLSRLRERKDRMLRKMDAMRDLTLGLMLAAGKTAVSLPIALVQARDGLPSVVVDNADELPQGYVKRQPNISAIRASLKNGDEVPGARLESGGKTLWIKST